MKYVFEIYEFCEKRGRTFKGYKTITCDSTESARLCAENNLPENHSLHQVYFPQEL
jgi:hypothetical protein